MNLKDIFNASVKKATESKEKEDEVRLVKINEKVERLEKLHDLLKFIEEIDEHKCKFEVERNEMFITKTRLKCNRIVGYVDDYDESKNEVYTNILHANTGFLWESVESFVDRMAFYLAVNPPTKPEDLM